MNDATNQLAVAKLDLSGEAPGRATRVADGFWILATRHHPGGSTRQPEINNRALIIKLQDQQLEEPVLVVFNAVDGEQAFSEVHRIEQETGLAVRYVVSVGGGHHLLMNAWHDEFTEARLLLGPVRVPRTANGKKLMELERVSVMDLHDPLPQFAGELDVNVFCGLLGGTDAPSVLEGGSDSMWAMAKTMVRVLRAGDPYDELWIHHRATRTVVGGENLGWQYTAQAHAKLPGMMKGFLKPDAVFVFTARKVGDPAEVGRCWKQVLSWPARNLLTYHDVLTHGFFDGDGQAALRAAVEAIGQPIG